MRCLFKRNIPRIRKVLHWPEHLARPPHIFRRVSQNCETQLVASSCLSLRLSATARIFINFISEYFSKMWSENSIFTKIWEETSGGGGTLLEHQYTFFLLYLAQIVLEWETFFGKIFRRKSKHTFRVQEWFFENRAVYRTMWGNSVERGRPQMTTRPILNTWG